ncbi:PEP-CTERM sorting domain-containing protein [Pseudoduganella chitinolytica]|uniref:PEP-CTERM sorting domain-containing protein n=1 Tax=Pseudoduganella chitinolytica TaxID=34070 RepID=A0ABY8B984_9BURK|nr:PEP-CTERM sorting domain-containing protein [Pseudoduganella chitinolytica]WEF32487.1 PEP-CTERM sorting domain-containing protein [Pseudoduganella chitinolytica]
MTSIYRATVLAAALAVPLCAHAALSASTTLGNVQWHVIDLTPGDGQSAGYDPVDAPHYRQVRTEIFSTAPFYLTSDIQTTGEDSMELDSAIAFGTAAAGAHAGPAFLDGRVTALGDPSLGRNGSVSSNMSGGFDFVLRPHTRLEISGRASWADLHQGSNGTASIRAESYFQAGELAGDDPAPPIHFQLRRGTMTGWADSADYQNFTLVYLNDTDRARSTNFYMSLHANVTNAVPEPGAIAMLLVGLAGVAVRLRRRGAGRASR